MKIFLIDNYDSFTYNLVHYFESFNIQVVVKRNNDFKLEELANFDRIVLSPGPGIPAEAGLMMEVIDSYHASKPILGICLGHQALAEYYGGYLYNMDDIYHGMSSEIRIDNDHFLFSNLSNTISVGRYHSWTVKNIPSDLRIIAESKNKEIMGISHANFPSVGVQFHPESVMTKQGLKIIENWLLHRF